MACKLNIPSAVAVLMLAASPCWAISTVTMPSNSDGTPRFTNPDNKPQTPFTGSVQTTIGVGRNSLGSGGSATFGNRTFGSGDTPASSIAPFIPQRGFSGSAPIGSNVTDPTFGPHGVYAPGLHDDLH
jgi:hypothetical protein